MESYCHWTCLFNFNICILDNSLLLVTCNFCLLSFIYLLIFFFSRFDWFNVWNWICHILSFVNLFINVSIGNFNIIFFKCLKFIFPHCWWRHRVQHALISRNAPLVCEIARKKNIGLQNVITWVWTRKIVKNQVFFYDILNIIIFFRMVGLVGKTNLKLAKFAIFKIDLLFLKLI